MPGRYTRTDLVDAGAFAAALEAARELAERTAADLHAGRIRPCPERCSNRGCRYPGICRAGEPGAEAAGMRSTPEQRAAIADRGRSSLLAAGAGSGKTAVMVERFAEAVLRDGVAVGAILTLTFTEKAAAELRERIRRRFVELGEAEHAREVDAAWIGTIHGFCARVLRSQPLAAGLDPRFVVLDEAAARRLATAAFEAALETWTAAQGAPAVDLAAAYSWDLEPLVTHAHGALRSRGAAHPRLRDPAAAAGARPGAARRAAAAAAGARCAPRRRTARASRRRSRRWRRARASIARPRASRRCPARSTRRSSRPARRRSSTATAPPTARRGPRTARRAPTITPGRCSRCSTRCSTRSAPPTRTPSRSAPASTSTTSSCACATCSPATPALRTRWAERFALIMVDEFQDTNRLQLDVLEALERDNLFAVGDESQSIYGFRHADVRIFRARRAALGASASVVSPSTSGRGTRSWTSSTPRSRRCWATVSRRSSRAGRPRSCGCSHPTRPRSRASSCSPSRPRAGRSARPSSGLAALAAQPWRRAEARAVAARLRAEVDAGRPQHDVVVLVRATSSLRLYEQALEEQGLSTYVVGGRGYWAQEQVRDGIAYLAAAREPARRGGAVRRARLAVLRRGTDALVAAGRGRPR